MDSFAFRHHLAERDANKYQLFITKELLVNYYIKMFIHKMLRNKVIKYKKLISDLKSYFVCAEVGSNNNKNFKIFGSK